MNNQIVFNPKEIIEMRLAESFGLNRYQEIQTQIHKVDISCDYNFQKKFNAFYRIRRNSDWRYIYYDLFESLKHEKEFVSFKYILEYMYRKTGNIEASFSSKMLATLDPVYPIWDQYVLKNLELNVPSKYRKNIDIFVEMYDNIIDWYEKFIESSEGQKSIEVFDNNMPKYKCISSTKKIDCFLWGKR